MKKIIILLPILFVALLACNEIPSVGIIKDVSTGVTTKYRNIKTGAVLKVMNDEIFTHNQIPLGENFQVINNEVSGFTVKNNNISIGGRLRITDKSGNLLLEEKDMFGTDSVYHKDSLSFLRCTVSTGSPMVTDEKYDVEIHYWDKFGDGEMTSNFEIEIIDHP